MRHFTPIVFWRRSCCVPHHGHQLQQHRFTAAGVKGIVPGLVNHCRLVQKIVEGDELQNTKCKRIAGVIRKIEENYIHWLGDCAPGECLLLLQSLASAVKYLKRNRPVTVGFSNDDDWSGASPHFSPAVSDWLCASLELCTRHFSTPQECLVLLSAAAELELPDTHTLQHLFRQLTKKDYMAKASIEELLSILWYISLLVKRCQVPIPPLDHLLCRLPSATLNSRQSLTVLSSLLRLQGRPSLDVVRIVSRRATEHVTTYSVKDVIYALEAIALLNCCHEAYSRSVLDRCTVLHAHLRPTELGTVCKYVAMLNTSRAKNEAAFSCAKELRRLLPALLSRTEELLGRFSLRDARCVLRCLEKHKVHHSVVFSRLTPLALDR